MEEDKKCLEIKIDEETTMYFTNNENTLKFAHDSRVQLAKDMQYGYRLCKVSC